VSTARNVGVVLVIAGLIAFLPGGGDASAIVSRVLSLSFIGVIVFGISWAYRHQRIDLEPLAPAYRALLYGAVGVIVLALAASSRLTPTAGGTLFLIGLLSAGAAGLYVVWREYHALA